MDLYAFKQRYKIKQNYYNYHILMTYERTKFTRQAAVVTELKTIKEQTIR